MLNTRFGYRQLEVNLIITLKTSISSILTFEKDSSDLKDGVFYGKCAELCGPSHALMDFKVKTMPRAEFDDWVAAMQATEGAIADTASADEGEAIICTKLYWLSCSYRVLVKQVHAVLT